MNRTSGISSSSASACSLIALTRAAFSAFSAALRSRGPGRGGDAEGRRAPRRKESVQRGWRVGQGGGVSSTPPGGLGRLLLLPLGLLGALILDHALVALADVLSQGADLRRRAQRAVSAALGRWCGCRSSERAGRRAFSLCSRASPRRIFLFSSSMSLRTCPRRRDAAARGAVDSAVRRHHRQARGQVRQTPRL